MALFVLFMLMILFYWFKRRRTWKWDHKSMNKN